MHGQKNRGEISPGELRCGDTRNAIRVDISTTHYLVYRDAFAGVEKMIRENVLSPIFFGKTKYSSLIVGPLSTIPEKKSGSGLLNPVTSEKDKYLISQRATTELIRYLTGGGAFSNSDQLLELME